VGLRFDHHGPRHPGAVILASIPRLLGDHGLTPGNSRARTTTPWRSVVTDEVTVRLPPLSCFGWRDTVTWETP
jgi:hypothetical protein